MMKYYSAIESYILKSKYCQAIMWGEIVVSEGIMGSMMQVSNIHILF